MNPILASVSRFWRSDPRETDRLIAAFPGPLHLRASRVQWWSLIAAGPALIALMIYVIITKPVPAHNALVLISISVAFALFLALAGGMRLGGSLHLDRKGFSVVAFRGQKPRRWSWTDVSDFQVVYIYKGGTYVAFSEMNEREPHLVGGAYWPGMEPTIPKAHTLLVRDQTILPESYGLSESELARLMEGWRTAADKASSKQTSLSDLPNSQSTAK